MTPRTMAIAYRIWVYASAREWNCSAAEIAEGIGESWKRVNMICRNKGWSSRLRKVYAGRLEVPHRMSRLHDASAVSIIPELRRQIEAEAWD